MARASVPSAGSRSLTPREQGRIQQRAAGLANHMLRSMINARGYAAAEQGRRYPGSGGAGSANAHLGAGLALLRDRSSQQVRDNPQGFAAITAMLASAVGTGITCHWETGSDRFDRQYAAAWEEFSATCDIRRKHDILGLQALAVRGMFERGDSITRHYAQPREAKGIPLQFQVLEGDLIDHGRLAPFGNDGRRVIQGVEVDAYGAAMGYWMFRDHPGETGAWGRNIAGLSSDFVPANRAIHLYEELRPGQVRGTPLLAPVLQLLNDLSDYEEAELLRKKVEACLAVFVTRNADNEDATIGGDDDGAAAGIDGADAAPVEDLHPAMIQYLQQGESITTLDPRATGGYADYKKSRLRDIATGIMATYQQLSGDLSDTNYSSFKAGQNIHRARIEQLQWLTIIPGWCLPTARLFAERAFVAGRVQKLIMAPRFTPPVMPTVDEQKEIGAAVDRIRAGLSTHAIELARYGEAYRPMIDRLIQEAKDRDEAGLVLSIDAAKVTAAGQPVSSNKAGDSAPAGKKPKE